MIQRIIPSIAVIIMTATVFSPSPAQAEKTFWQYLFPYHVPQDEVIYPEQTLEAPFPVMPAEDMKDPDNKLLSLYEGEAEENTQDIIGLDKPHRSLEEIRAWLGRAMAEILTMNADDYEDHLTLLKTGMNEAALTDFSSFIQSSRTLDTLRTNNMRMVGVVDAPPLLLNEGVIGGRYRWLMEMPVTLSFIPKGLQEYGRKSDFVNQAVLVTVQIGRVEKGSGADDMMIESFKIRKNPAR